jgi:hypothetical protein
VAHRVTINRRIGELWQIVLRQDIMSADASIGAIKRHGLYIGEDWHAFGDEGDRLLDPHELAPEGEAIVGQLCHRLQLSRLTGFYRASTLSGTFARVTTILAIPAVSSSPNSSPRFRLRLVARGRRRAMWQVGQHPAAGLYQAAKP